MQVASYGEDLLSTARLPHADGASKHGGGVPISQSRIHCPSTRFFVKR